ncbi:MAG TPA: hypothetical protein VMS40_27230, partial [Vicinamibacterales bacterium]|nr:hypothetical protein [Vicinamibacterales bacterium]
MKAVTAALLFAMGVPLDVGRVFRPAGEPGLPPSRFCASASLAVARVFGASGGGKTRPTFNAQPALAAAAQSSEPPILKRRLSNGLNVWIIEH